MKPALVVLAAGMGSRYGGLKQIDPVGPNGEIILDYSIYDALRNGFGKVVFVIRRDTESLFREAVGSRWEGKIEIAYAHQELDALPKGFSIPEGRTKPWGTGHAVLCAAKAVQGPFAVINADDFYGGSGYALLGKALTEPQGSAKPRHFMVGFTLKNTLSEFGAVSRGVCQCGADGILKEVVERTKIEPEGDGAAFVDEGGVKRKLSGAETVSMNMWGFMPSIFPELERLFSDFMAVSGKEAKSEFYLPFAAASLIKEGKAEFKVLSSSDSWFGVTYREDKPRVQSSVKALIDSGRYPAKLL